MMLAIDPGLKGCGCALFENSVLIRAAYVESLEDEYALNPWSKMRLAILDWRWPVDRTVIELPRVYQGRKQKGDPEDLIQLAALVGALGSNGWTTIVRPHEWKGSVPKGIMTERILTRLSRDEQQAIKTAGAKTHNIIDAIGIGLFFLGRLKK